MPKKTYKKTGKPADTKFRLGKAPPIDYDSRKSRGTKVKVKKRKSKKRKATGGGGAIAENRPMTGRERLAASGGRGGGLKPAAFKRPPTRLANGHASFT